MASSKGSAAVSGFPEWLPGDRLVERHVIQTLERVFELHGFSNIETRAVEPLAALESKGETSKQVYLLQRLQAARGGTVGEPSGRDLGLHFDLTVPLARYVLQNAATLHFPFRRYQIQKVWRGERPQEGRFREFTQADIDIVGLDHLGFHHEVEAARVMLSALDALGIPRVLMEVNNRRLLQGLLSAAGVSSFDETLRALDKLDKVGVEGVSAELQTCGLSSAQVKSVIAIASITAKESAHLRQQVDALGLSPEGDDAELVSRGLDELCELLDQANRTSRKLTGHRQVRASLRIARGLDYYTGTVYETIIPGFESFGSICSGGRYDTLVSQGRRTYPGVGLSIGVTRLVSLLLNKQLLAASRPTPSVVFVAVASEDDRERSDQVADALRARGIAAEVAAKPQRFGRQIEAADKRGVPYVWFPSQEGADQVKDIRSGEQSDADAHTWSPEERDLLVEVARPL